MDEDHDLEERLAFVTRRITETEDEIGVLNLQLKNLQDERDVLREKKLAKKSKFVSSQDWDKENFPWSGELRSCLKTAFKLNDFRSQQLQAINAVLSKTNVLLLAPTGGGKSLCYQLPAVISRGVTLVVSPLISLMEDQVQSLKRLGIQSTFFTSDKEQGRAIYEALRVGDTSTPLKLLYVTPERLAKSRRLMTCIQKCYQAGKLELIAIDEVHCCSQWGHDFRPDYKYLSTLRSMFPDVPVLGVTATATASVLRDVQKMLSIQECLVLRAPFNRPNLYYHIVQKPTEKEEVYIMLADWLKRRYHQQSGIIYTLTIKDAEDVSSALLVRDVKVRPYHANLAPETRTQTHAKWVSGSIQAVVATIAFGMGIDKPNVRFVIHHSMSKSIENFYQESGRAGRDGDSADCILLYRLADVFRISAMVFTDHTGLKNLYNMVSYCMDSTRCRRSIIAKYFHEVWNDTECRDKCDRCLFRRKVAPKKINLKPHLDNLLKIMAKASMSEIKLTGAKLLDAWYKKGSVPLRCTDIDVPALNRIYGEQVVAYLIVEGYLMEDFHFTAYSTISYLKRGAMGVSPGQEIPFQPIRVLSLPDNEAVASDSDNDMEMILPRKRRRKIASSNDGGTSTRSTSNYVEGLITDMKTEDDVECIDIASEVIELE